MKAILLIQLVSLLTISGFSQAVAWELSAEPGNQVTSAATTQGANFTNCVLSRGAGITATAGAGSMNSSGWFAGSSATTLAEAIANNDYYEFSINTTNCLFFNPTTMHIVLRSSNTGPNTATLRCSSDGFTTDIGTVSVTVNSVQYTFTETVSPNSQSVIYRLYGYGGAANGTPGSGGTMRIGTSVISGDNDLDVFATTTMLLAAPVTNITVDEGDIVPLTALTANVPGSVISWSRTPENIGLVQTNGTGDIPSFTADISGSMPVTSTFSFSANINGCASADQMFTMTVNPPPCTISTTLLGSPSACNDNGTPNDPSDDFFTQNVSCIFFNRPLTGNLQIVPGGDQIGTYSIPVDQIVGNSHIFTGVKFKADGTPTFYQVNFTDETTCIDDFTGSSVPSCSVPPPPCTITTTLLGSPSACNDNGTPNDPTDDFFTQNVSSVFFNRPLTGNLQIVPGGDQIGTYSIPVDQIVGNSHIFTGVKFKADGTPTFYEVNFTDDPTCIDDFTGSSVPSCSVPPPPCTITTTLLGSPGACNDNGTPNDPTDDFFTQNVSCTFFNRPLTGSLQIVPGGDQIGTYSIPVDQIIGNSHVFSGVKFKADGTPTFYQANFTDDLTCIDDFTGPAVNACSSGGGPCAVNSVSVVNVGPCNDNGTGNLTDDFYTADVVVNFVNPPATGNLEIELPGDVVPGGGSTSVPVAGLTSPHTFTGVRFKADGTITVVEVDFTDDQSCVRTATGPTVQPCSVPCSISSVTVLNAGPCNNNNTSDPTDDYFTADVNVVFNNPPGTGFMEIELPGDVVPGGGATSVPVAGLTSPYTFTGVRFKADGTITVVEVDFTADQSCVRTAVGPTVPPCSYLPPMLTCPVNVTLQCAANVPPPNAASVIVVYECPGNATVIHLGDVISNQVCANQYVITRTYQATDECGQTATCNQTLTVFDNTPPMLTCPVNVTVQCANNVPPPSPPPATDNCGGATTVVHVNDVTVNQTCTNRYTLNRTYRATDNCGNSTTCLQVITVFDNTGPSITCPVNVTVQCAENVPPPSLPNATDNCGGVTTVVHVSDVTVNQTCINRYTLNRTYRATDVCGNSTTCVQVITVFDNTVPTLTCPGPVTVQCATDVPPVNTAGVTTADNCSGGVTVTLAADITVNQTCINRYVLNRVYRATDACGNSATCVQVITVFDNTPPVITFSDPLIMGLANGATFEVQCYGQDPEWDLPEFNGNSVSVTDNCTGPVSVNFVQTLQDAGHCPEDGYINLYRLTWTATDACGNTSSKYLLMALVDHIPPQIHGVPPDVTVNCDAVPGLPENVYATDECIDAEIFSFIETVPAPGCQDGQVISRTWSAIDECGNVGVAIQHITLVDHKGPELIVQLPELYGASDGTIYDYTCNEGGIPDFFDELNAESVYSPPSCGNSGLITFDRHDFKTSNCKFFGYLEQRVYHWHGADACGNTTDLTLFARLIDTEPPVIIGLPDVACINDPALDEVDVIDNCEHPSLIYWDVTIPNPCGPGTAVRRTYEAKDDCFNMVRDTVILISPPATGPVIVFVNPLLVDLDPGEVLTVDCAVQNGQQTPFGPGDVRVDGACAENASVDFSEKILEARNCENAGILTMLELTWTATDLCGGQSTLSVHVNVVDHSSPQLVDFRPEITLPCTSPLPDIRAVDNCGEVTLNVEDKVMPGSCAYEYDVERHITATDPCGNVTVATQLVHIGDGTGPVLVGVIPELCDDLSLPEVSAYDPCAGVFVPVSLVEHQLDIPCRDGRVIERIWSAKDACGNTSVQHQHIIVGDHTAPVILIPTYSIILKYLDTPEPNRVTLSQTNIIDALNNLGDASVYIEDDCDALIVPEFSLEISYAEDCASDGYFEHRVYTWIATDVCGNSSSITFSIDIVDDLAPMFGSVPEDITVICNAVPAAPQVSVNDPAQPVEVLYGESILPGSSNGSYDITRTWTATDACGNVAHAVQHVHWIPDTFLACDINVPPAVSCNSHGVVISGNAEGGLGDYTYLWDVQGGGFIQSGQGTDEIKIYVGWENVNIQLFVTDAYGCTTNCVTTLYCLDPAIGMMAPGDQNNQVYALQDKTGAIYLHSTENDFHQGISDMQIWPNPANTILNLRYAAAGEEGIVCRFANLLGQVIYMEELHAQAGENTHQFDISLIPAGNYIVQLKSNKDILSSSLFILHTK